jgi:prevent-host-death family protein
MSMEEDIRPITYLKAKTADLLRQVNETQRPVVITQNGEPRAVIQDPRSYESMRNAIGMLKLLAQGEEDVRKGKLVPQADLLARLQAAIDKR